MGIGYGNNLKSCPRCGYSSGAEGYPLSSPEGYDRFNPNYSINSKAVSRYQTKQVKYDK